MTAPGGVIATVYVQVLPEINKFAQQLRSGLRQSSRELRMIDREITPVARGLENLGKVATGIVPGIRLARTSLLALGSHAVVGGILSAAGAVTTLTGALLVLPAAGAAAGSIAGTLGIGLLGVGDALKQYFKDVDKFREKTAELSTNAQATLGVFDDLRGSVLEFRDSIQDKLFAGMDETVSNLATTFLPRLVKHFGNLADIINLGAKDLAGFAQQADTLADFDGVANNIESAFSLLRPALVPIAQAIRDIVTVGSRALPQLALEIQQVAQRFADWIAQMRQTGQLDQFIQNGIEAFKQLFRILSNVGHAIGAILGAAQESGNGFLDTLEKLTGKVREFFESARGQNAVKDFLDTTADAAKALTPVITAIADFVFNHLFPVFEDFATRVGPSVAGFFLALGDALDIAAPGINAFATGFGDFIASITPVLPIIGALIGQIGSLVGVLSAKLGPIITEIVTAIANVLTPILNALLGIFVLISPEVLKFVVVIGTVIIAIAGLLNIVRGFQAVAGLFAGGFQAITSGALKSQGAVTGLASFLGGPWGIAIGAALIGLGLFLSESDDTTSSVNDLATAMENATGSTEDAADEWIRQKLEMDGLGDSAQQLGISINDLVDAYKGLAPAQETVIESLGRSAQAGDLSFEQYEKLIETLQQGPETYQKAGEAVDRKAEADRQGATASEQAAAATKAQTESLRGLFDEVNERQKQQLAALNADINYRTQLQTTTAELQRSTGNLDINTEAGQNNLKTLGDLAAAGAQRVQGLIDQGAATHDVNLLIAQNRETILSLITPYFSSKAAAEQFATSIGLIPPSPTVKPVFDDKQARNDANSFSAYINSLMYDRTINVNVNEAPAGGGGLLGNSGRPGKARGGPVMPGQWTWVGEEGPELVRFGRAARVFSNDESERMSRSVYDLDTITARPSNGMARATDYGRTGGNDGVGAGQVTNQISVEPVIRVYIDGQELRGMVHVEIERRDRKFQRLVTTNTGGR